DPTRAYHEARDWFRFEFAVHQGESHLGVRALYRSAGWVLPLLVALGVRRGANRLATIGSLARGIRDAVREPRHGLRST
ncbi:MAG: hypothetical protein L3J96_06835, partial [Thermoplasmata archaeon]|nr:hypothetical protein [Thermoplasmata archaeon]